MHRLHRGIEGLRSLPHTQPRIDAQREATSEEEQGRSAPGGGLSTGCSHPQRIVRRGCPNDAQWQDR